MSFHPTSYQLFNPLTGHRFADMGWTLSDPDCNQPVLLRAIYAQTSFQPRDDLDGLYRYASWLPVRRTLHHSCAPVTYRSAGLARALGLNRLYITFSGWHPEIGARFRTCSFKETEAYSVLGRLDEAERRILIIQSAGNTARAFAQVCSDNHIPVLICIPGDNLRDLWFHSPLNPCVRVLATPHGTDYYDAIALGNSLARDTRFLLEGGATNIARRDGMATTLLSAVEQMQRIPDAYFQAVGSGTGAIAAWECACRLAEDGRFGPNRMRVCVAQNSPFTLIHDAWQQRQRAMPPLSEQLGRRQSEAILAKVLSNRRPPYSIHGGLYDTLRLSHGNSFAVTNTQLLDWQRRFAELEGIELHPAAAVAVAALAQAVRQHLVQPDEFISLNCTGGGIQRAQEQGCWYKPADMVLSAETELSEQVREQIWSWWN